MKKVFLIIGLVGLSILSTSCDRDLEGMNTDTKHPDVVPASALFTTAQRSLTDQMVNTSVNRNVFRLIVQQWAQTTYFDESAYDFVSRKISDNHSNAIYAGTLADLEKARLYVVGEVLNPADPDYATKVIERKNKLAVIDILMVYAFQVMVDTYGNVPYSEALKFDQNFLPKYDDALGIYKSLIAKLDADLANIDTSHSAFGGADILYSDDLSLWKKFANSIKLKLGVNLAASNKDNMTAKQAIESAALNVISSNSENAKLKYMPTLPNTNPLFVDLVNSGRNDFVVSKTIINKLVALGDPRLPKYVDPDGPQTGGTSGVGNSYSSRAHIAPRIKEPDFPGTLLDYAEVEFLLAEAKARGFTIAGTIDSHYTNAITASLQDWGVSSYDIGLYLSNPNVIYATAPGATWQEKIGNQAYLAMYNRGFESWTFWRRLDFPVLTPPSSANAEAEGKVPVRLKYPIREQTLNVNNYNAAATAIGGDKLTTKVFWDIN